ncbi:DUF3836 domain-containing protein [Dysgonomonas sp. 511]|nr:DUF3836 domain-containing protein [Dysgonomonas sp. 511]
MKANILLVTLLAAFLSVAVLNAGNPNKVVYSNVSTTDSGTIKEYVVYDKEMGKAEKKCVYNYDNGGNLLSKLEYKWDGRKGWLNASKSEYEYRDGVIAYVTHTKWDKKNNKWADQSERMVYDYDSEGDFLAVQQVNVNNNDLIAQR